MIPPRPQRGHCARQYCVCGLFVFCGRQYVELCRTRGLNSEAERAQQHIDAMCQAVEKYGWDGAWYLRAYDYYGNKVGCMIMDSRQALLHR